MSELNLRACPICHAEDCLSRNMMEEKAHVFIWYECRECGSVLLGLNDDQWAYQKVGREEKSHLLKCPMTLSELQALLPETGADVSNPSVHQGAPDQVSRRAGRQSAIRVLIPWLLALCIIGFLGLVALALHRAEVVSSLFPTATPQAMSTPSFSAGDQVILTGAGFLWQVSNGCGLDKTLSSVSEGTQAIVLNERCYHARQREYLYRVSVGGVEGWVREGCMVSPSAYVPVPTNTPSPRLTPDRRSLIPDRRSPFEKCAQSGRGVRYVISGSGVSRVFLTWANDFGGTNQGDSSVPLCEMFDGFNKGDFLYISAQIIEGNGSIQCRIYDHTTLIAEGQASGFASIATCSGVAVWSSVP